MNRQMLVNDANTNTPQNTVVVPFVNCMLQTTMIGGLYFERVRLSKEFDTLFGGNGGTDRQIPPGLREIGIMRIRCRCN